MIAPCGVVVVGIDDGHQVERRLIGKVVVVWRLHCRACHNLATRDFIAALVAVNGHHSIAVGSEFRGADSLAECRFRDTFGHNLLVGIACHVVFQSADESVVVSAHWSFPCQGHLSCGAVALQRKVFHRECLVVTDVLACSRLGTAAHAVGRCHHKLVGAAAAHGHFLLHCGTCRSSAISHGFAVDLYSICKATAKFTSGKRFARSGECHLARERCTLEVQSDVFNGCRSAVFSSRFRYGESQHLFATREHTHFGSRSGGQVNRIQSRIEVGVYRSPVERIGLRINLTALRIGAAVASGQCQSGRADKSFLCRLAVYAIQVAVAGHTVDSLVGCDAESHIPVGKVTANLRARHGVVVYGAEDGRSAGRGVVELSVHRSVRSYGGLSSYARYVVET